VKLAFDDPDLDAQLVRTIAVAPAGCADLGEAYATAGRITDGDRDAWHDQWRRSADTSLALAEACLAGGHQASARDGLLRACEYYRQAFYFLRHDLDDPRLADAYATHRDTFRQAIPLLPWTCQPVQIPYQATTLAGYLLRPTPDLRPRPTVLAPAGYDSTAEAGYPATAVHALTRGYACLIYEGPGQGGVLYRQRLFLRHDYEHVLTPVVDWLSAQPGVDPTRIALVGHSFAGYLGLRGATGEPRLAGLVLNPAQYDFAARLRAMLGDDLYDWVQAGDPAADAAVDRLVSDPHQRQDLLARAAAHGTATLGDYLRALSRFSARGLADRIACPTLVLDAEDDFASDGQADQLAADLTCPVTRHRLTRADGTAGHSGGLGQQCLAQIIFDWLDTTLRVTPARPCQSITPTT
jgi:alpha-beta hydrolase superfamily lysophospholipase